MRHRAIDLVLTAVTTVAALLLSWPFWAHFEYWADSRALWIVYVIIGAILAGYVFYAFLGALHTLFEHDALDHAEAREAAKGGADTENRS